MFNLYAFSHAVATSTSLSAVTPAVGDPIITVSGNLMYVPAFTNLLGCYAIGASIDRAQLQSPTLLNIAPYDITPVDVSVDPSSPLPLRLQTASPIKLTQYEGLQAYVTNTANTDASVIVFLGDGAIAPITGPMSEVRGTFTTSGAVDTFVNSAISFTTNLAAGTYNIVGMRVEGVHGIAARLVFQGNQSNRPGVIFTGSVAKLDSETFRHGNMGVLGEFSPTNPPSIDSLTDGTSETATVIFDVIKTA